MSETSKTPNYTNREAADVVVGNLLSRLNFNAVNGNGTQTLYNPDTKDLYAAWQLSKWKKSGAWYEVNCILSILSHSVIYSTEYQALGKLGDDVEKFAAKHKIKIDDGTIKK